MTDILLDNLTAIRKAMREHEARYADRLGRVHPKNQRSAVNLIHYLALRSLDTADLQRVLDMATWTNLNEFKRTTIPR